MEEIDVFRKLNEASNMQQADFLFAQEDENARKLASHRAWLQSIRRERPSTEIPYKVGVYIRYFNQTRYEDYLENHKSRFISALDLCPQWQFVGFYIDEGSTAPNMERAPEWGRLLNDAFDGKVDLIITQKVSNVSKKSYEVSLCARLLAQQQHPIGIYFVSEDIFTLSSYYLDDMKDASFLPNGWSVQLDEVTQKELLHD